MMLRLMVLVSASLGRPGGFGVSDLDSQMTAINVNAVTLARNSSSKAV